jgi:hypothetical protein
MEMRQALHMLQAPTSLIEIGSIRWKAVEGVLVALEQIQGPR